MARSVVGHGPPSVSGHHGERLAQAGIQLSTDFKRGAGEHTPAKVINGLRNTELRQRRAQCKILEAQELTMREWAWWFNRHRLLGTSATTYRADATSPHRRQAASQGPDRSRTKRSSHRPPS